MSPIFNCLASAAAVWIGAILVSERAWLSRSDKRAQPAPETTARLSMLRFAIAPLTGVWPLLLLLAVSGRVIFSTLSVLAFLVTMALVSYAKRKILHEPLVWSDFALVGHVLRHPGMYIPFVGTWRFVGLAIPVVSAPIGMQFLESSLWAAMPAVLFWPRAGLFMGSAILMAAWPFLVRALFKPGQPDGIEPSNEPDHDIARFGFIGTLLLQYVSSTNKKRLEQIRSHRPQLSLTARSVDDFPHICIVQAESFFDVRRLFACIKEEPPIRLANFERACMEGVMSGPFEVSAWGANSERTEFAALSTIPREVLGVHWFNPYLSVARQPVWTIAQHLRSLGYRTILVHPYSKTFFWRDKVYRNLGFDEFYDIDAFAEAPRCGLHVCDREIAGQVRNLLSENSDNQPTFVFAITIEAHGPWLEQSGGSEISDSLPNLPASIASYELARYLYHVGHMDQLLGDLMNLASDLRRRTVLGMYGDHLPMLSHTYKQIGFDEFPTDYVIWRGGSKPGNSVTTPLAPEELALAVLFAADLTEANPKLFDQMQAGTVD